MRTPAALSKSRNATGLQDRTTLSERFKDRTTFRARGNLR